MKRHLAFVGAAMLSLSLLPAQFGPGRGRQAEPPQLEHFTFESWDFSTDAMRGGEASYYTYLPKGHDLDANKDEKYPWVLWLPGFGGPEDFQSRGGAQTLDRLRGEGKIPELVLVVFRPPGRGRSTYMNGEQIGDVEDLLVGDLLADVQKRFRVATDRAHRAVMGCSAGGFGALKLALRHPDLFGAVAVHSAAILPADPAELSGMTESVVMRALRGDLEKELGNPIDKDKWAEQMPMALVARRKPEQLQGLQIYFDAGDEDRYGLYEPNVALHEAMQKHHHRHLFRAIAGGGHAWGSPSMLENLAVSLQFVGKALSGEDAVEAMTPKDEPAKKDEKGGGR
ncbi:MAG: prolyl oligopeptidase family serine peptidase [Planctomycetes bacterium]|nr:prolyl oligopeptidase family serine peptidase [Planctomycetota bacterium]